MDFEIEKEVEKAALRTRLNGLLTNGGGVAMSVEVCSQTFGGVIARSHDHVTHMKPLGTAAFKPTVSIGEVAEAAAQLFVAVDENRDHVVTLEELEAALQSNPRLSVQLGLARRTQKVIWIDHSIWTLTDPWCP